MARKKKEPEKAPEGEIEQAELEAQEEQAQEPAPQPVISSRNQKYDPKYCAEMVDFFTIKEPFQLVTKTKSYYPAKDGGAQQIKTEHQEIVPTPPPFFEAFARKIGVSHRTLGDWAKKYPDFAEAMTTCQDLRRELIISNGLIGRYDPKYTQFASKNMVEIGWKDEIDHSMKVDSSSLEDIWRKREKSLQRKTNEKQQDQNTEQ